MRISWFKVWCGLMATVSLISLIVAAVFAIKTVQLKRETARIEQHTRELNARPATFEPAPIRIADATPVPVPECKPNELQAQFAHDLGGSPCSYMRVTENGMLYRGPEVAVTVPERYVIDHSPGSDPTDKKDQRVRSCQGDHIKVASFTAYYIGDLQFNCTHKQP